MPPLVVLCFDYEKTITLKTYACSYSEMSCRIYRNVHAVINGKDAQFERNLHILPRRNYDLGFSVENVVFFELLRRGYKVNIGKYENSEIDFVVQKKGIVTYFQVTADMTAKTTFDREMSPFYKIKDNYEKIVLTLDRFTLGNYEGIKVVNVIDWLLGNE